MEERDARVVSIVDDDASIRRAVMNLLLSLGLEAESFDSAEAFLQSVRLERTGCLILDLRMPGIGGLELLEQLAAAGQHIPTVILTAHDDDKERERASQAGAVAFLSKPFRSDALISAVKSAMVRA